MKIYKIFLRYFLYIFILVSENEKLLNQLDDLVVSDSLSCSFCNTIFEDKAQQRLHYKLDWHRYNLKQRLNGLKPINEDKFSLLADEGIKIKIIKIIRHIKLSHSI